MIALPEALSKKRLLFDGSMGALLASMGHVSDCPELFCIERPDVIEGIHRAYLEAGAEVLITNSLGASPIKLGRAGLGDRAAALNQAAVGCAVRASEGRAYVALDMGTSGAFLEPSGTLTFDDAARNFEVSARAGAEAGAHFILLETITDIAEARAILFAARATGLPVACSFTFEPGGRTLTGGTPECAALVMRAMGAVALGINCSASPTHMLAPLAAMRAAAPLPVIVQPNAGLPTRDVDGTTRFPLTAEMMLPHMRAILDAGAAAIGGCCGTTPEHIRAFAALMPEDVPAPAWDGVVRICSSREALALDAAQKSAIEIDDPDDLFDLEAGEAALISLIGLTPDEAAERVLEAQSLSPRPFVLRAADADVLRAALKVYAGVAAVDTGADCAEAAREFGALRI